MTRANEGWLAMTVDQVVDIIMSKTKIIDYTIARAVAIQIRDQEILDVTPKELNPTIIYAPYIPIYVTNPCGEIPLIPEKPLDNPGKILYSNIVDRKTLWNPQ